MTHRVLLDEIVQQAVTGNVSVSIIIPVFNKLAFTKQCLERLTRHSSRNYPHEVIVVDNGSTDGTTEFLKDLSQRDPFVIHVAHTANLGFSRGNNAGARHARGEYLLFLNNDTLVQEGWLDEMVRVAEADPHVGIVGIKQLFPYTNLIHHTGIIFTADRRPQHIYPHANASLSYVNKQREYQAVTGSCLLISRDLFFSCGMFDEEYRNGYEDVDLCLGVRERNRSVVCCTKSFIYHYGQITDTRTADDDKNVVRFMDKWSSRIEPDELKYFREDQREIQAPSTRRPAVGRRARPKGLYFADDLSTGSALTWVTGELALALRRMDVDVALKACQLPVSTDGTKRRELESLMVRDQPLGGIHIKWSHYWPQHLNLDLNGSINLELFVINYHFDRPGSQPWDYWLQCLTQNRYLKLPLSTFCRDVLTQTGLPAHACHILRPGYSPEASEALAGTRESSAFRFLTVTNSHDLERYGTKLLLEAYWQTFSRADDVVLVVKDYGVSSGDRTLQRLFREYDGQARIEYITEFTTKRKLIELYRSCDAFVSAHRGEGYGMKILDALACGMPVITPLYGGPTDFCTAENCFPVDFSLVPVGDCLDTRSLNITNSPVWAEPDIRSVAHQLRRVATDRDAARHVGVRGRSDVLGRLSWDQTAREFASFLDALEANRPTRLCSSEVFEHGATVSERSPYWMGIRISVVIPTYNRKGLLLKCLRALERQTVLPQEFEVIVVDDGSTDGTRQLLASEQFPFNVKYYFQENRGPGTARNEAILRASGELVLFIGDDIIAHERLLEEHLTAHASRPEPGTAILGHIEWAPELPRSSVMDFVCGESSLQFAYAHIPKLPSLDYRFFYTSNISLKRQFLIDAASDGVAFDPDFRFAAFEDSEYALRLERRGLQISYRAEACGYHDHYMDLESFSRREYLAGQMAVVFYRKHPQIDEQLQVKWIGDWTSAVDRIAANDELSARLRALDADTDQFLQSLVRSLEDFVRLQSETIDAPLPKISLNTATRSLDGTLAVIFDAARTRGKVEEWYSRVTDRDRTETAKRLLGCVRKLEFFSAQPAEMERLRGTLAWLSHDVVGNLRTRIADLERQIGISGGSPFARLPRSARRAARNADLFVLHHLASRPYWLRHYQRIRHGLKRLAYRSAALRE